MKSSLKYLSEFFGTCSLLIIIVGSGIMGDSLSHGNPAITLLANSIATGAGLYFLIQSLSTISGAHFNPAVSLVEYLNNKISLKEFIIYSFSQISGGVLGVWITHAMFGKVIFQLSNQHRSEPRLLLSELTATLGLISTIKLTGKNSPDKTPIAVSLYIVAAYWCTSSTSFANPAVTIARSLTDTFSGIYWQDAPLFIAAQLCGGLIWVLLS